MDNIYLEIWKLAKPYYLQGRVYDIPHVEWMMKQGDRIADLENFDKKLLLPIIILHDVGYSKSGQKNPNIKGKESKILHMKEGAKIAREILEKINYDLDLTDKIVHYISVHDNWILGDDKPFKECREMALFNDLDYLDLFIRYEAFKLAAKSMGKSVQELFDLYTNDEKLARRPFCCQETKKLFDEAVKNLKEEIDSKDV